MYKSPLKKFSFYKNGTDGEAGVGIESVNAQYYLSTSKTEQKGGNWSTIAPTWEKGKYLWIRNEIIYTNGTKVRTVPYCDNSWEAVNDVDAQISAWCYNNNNTYIDGSKIYTGTITALGNVTAGSFNLGNNNFVVTSDGKLTAKSAELEGKITATSGKISFLQVKENTLYANFFGENTPVDYMFSKNSFTARTYNDNNELIAYISTDDMAPSVTNPSLVGRTILFGNAGVSMRTNGSFGVVSESESTSYFEVDVENKKIKCNYPVFVYDNDLTVSNGAIVGKYLRTTATNASSVAAEKICIQLGDGTVYTRTPAQILSDIGAAASSHSHSNYASSSHTHDDRYYTESEVDSKLNGKANSSHSHSEYASSSHSHSNYIGTSYGGININTSYNLGCYGLQGGSSGCPSGSQYGVVLNMPYRQASGNTKQDFATQIFIPNGDDSTSPNSMFYRTSTGSAWNSWQEVMKKYKVLYSNSSGTTGTVTLSETSANFTFIIIIIGFSDTGASGSLVVYSPNGKTVDAGITTVSSDTSTIARIRYAISGTTMTASNNYSTKFKASSYTTSSNSAYCKAVLGFK